jgi:hypothetical protein
MTWDEWRARVRPLTEQVEKSKLATTSLRFQFAVMAMTGINHLLLERGDFDNDDPNVPDFAANLLPEVERVFAMERAN